MSTVLGIDAGGTYTDCVVIDADTHSVLHQAKTLTTRDDLTRCLGTSFAGLPRRLVPSIGVVCLSTTLATNAIVEGHGCREGLILIGGEPRGRLPSSRRVLLKGRYDIKGRVVENIDPAQVVDAVESLRGTVDAVAVSGYASVRSPDHELYVKAVVEDRLAVPVVCAHELTSRLGHYERTVTAALNARLIPLICDLMDAVKDVMARYEVQAPLMMVRGDGTLMADGLARAKPIETIMSGPAASAIGAVHLSGQQDCFVVDIGGTTTDVANVSGGRLSIRTDGARVGGWSTQVRAVEVFTVGLGGDSRIRLDPHRRLCIGPQRSVSYALAASRHPHLLDELEEIRSEGAHHRFVHPEQEAYRFVRTGDRRAWSAEESRVLAGLRGGPHTMFHLNRTVELPGLPAVLAELVRYGVLERISLTPTDVWHVSGQYAPADTRAAGLAVQITADMLGSSSAQLVAQVQRALLAQVELSAVRAAMYMDHQPPELDQGGVADNFLNRLCFAPDSQTLRASYRLLKPVVAIGAPSATWLGHASPTSLPLAEVPDHSEVANAVGAALAHAVEQVEVLIRQDTVSGQFLVFSPRGRQARATLEEATEAALTSGEEFLARLTRRPDLAVDSRVDDVRITSLAADRSLFVERVVTVTGRLQP